MTSIEKVAIIGHPKDFAALSVDKAFVWQEAESVVTPFGTAQIRRGSYEEGVPIGFCDRYSAEVVAGPHVRPEALMLALAMRQYRSVLAINGTGSINSRFRVGDFVVPSDFIEFSTDQSAGYYSTVPGGIFFRLNPAFCPSLRSLLITSGSRERLNIHPEGICGVTRQRLETPAEVRMYQILGADLLNMRLASEAVLCRQLELCFASLCFVLNEAEGRIQTNDIGFNALKRNFDQAALDESKRRIIKAFLQLYSTSARCCQCRDALAEVKRAGILHDPLADEIIRRSRRE